MPASRHASRWTALAAALVGLFVLAVGAACTPEQQSELRTYAGINAIREKHGLPPLIADAGIVEVARIRSRDMSANNYFSHDPPDGCDYVCLMDQHGVPYAYAGENIAWNTWDWTKSADVAVQMWENSPPHLRNILDCHYERFGTGVAKARDGRVYYTMIFEGNRAC